MTGAIAKIIFIPLLTFGFCEICKSQNPQKSILLAGVVLDVQEQKEIPYVNVKVKNTFYGTATDINGYFSLFINPGDTIVFSYVGYERASFVMPIELQSDQYSIVQLMIKDTMLLKTVTVFPWPDYNDFIEAFLDAKPARDMDDLVIEVKQKIPTLVKETEQGHYYYEQQRYQKLFMMHEIFPPNNFLDPSRWTDFIRDLSTKEKKDD